MPILLLLLFVGVPLLEIWVILQVGDLIGPWWTVALLVANSLVGAWLVKLEGRRAWSQFREALGAGRWPGDEVVQGALIIVGGTLLLTPGFITDAVGFILLVAPTRAIVARVLRARFAVGLAGRAARAAGDPAATPRRGPVAGGPGTGRDRRRTDARRGPSRGPSAGELDIEVVEIRREPLPPRPGDPDDEHR